MEMTKKPAARQPQISPTPFSSSAERAELERALLQTTTSTSTESTSSTQNYFVPTAVPIVAGDTFDENIVAVAASVASLPAPPPTCAPAAASAATSTRTTTTNKNATAYKHKSAKNEKSQSSIEDDDDDDVIVRPEPPSYNMNDFPLLPSAPTLPTHTTNLPSTQQLTTSAQLRAANVWGGLSSEEEFVDVARAQRTRSVIHHHAGEAVRTANVKAISKAGRSDEGLTVDEDLYRVNNNYLKEGGEEGEVGDDDDDVRSYGNKQQVGKGGYEVKEYDISEYDTSEYDVAEYKSVYD